MSSSLCVCVGAANLDVRNEALVEDPHVAVTVTWLSDAGSEAVSLWEERASAPAAAAKRPTAEDATSTPLRVKDVGFEASSAPFEADEATVSSLLGVVVRIDVLLTAACVGGHDGGRS